MEIDTVINRTTKEIIESKQFEFIKTFLLEKECYFSEEEHFRFSTTYDSEFLSFYRIAKGINFEMEFQEFICEKFGNSFTLKLELLQDGRVEDISKHIHNESMFKTILNDAVIEDLQNEEELFQELYEYLNDCIKTNERIVNIIRVEKDAV